MGKRSSQSSSRSSVGRIAWLVGGILVIIVLVSLIAVFSGMGGSSTNPTTDDSTEVVPTITPEFVPGGTASENEAFFNWINQQTIAATGRQPTGEDFINALTAGGFDRAAMQLTADTTAADLQADSIQFSVQIGTECLIGQWGTGSDGYKVERTNAIDGIGCLIGKTRPIDW